MQCSSVVPFVSDLGVRLVNCSLSGVLCHISFNIALKGPARCLGVKVPAAKPNDLSLASGTHVMEGNNGLLQVVL